MAPTWQELAKKACDVRDASLAKVDPPLGPLPEPLPLNTRDLPKQMLTPREYELTTKYSAIELLKMLHSKELKSEELTRAYLRSAALSQLAINCVAEILWDEAIERAKYLDSLPSPIGPLHGLPISMKGQQGMAIYNKPSHGGYVAWVDKPSEPNPINDILFDAGCVYYVRTTEPQTTMHVECNNNIYGRTVNSYNSNLTCGGSSGGEGAILGFRASVFGVGGDIGGSIRVPAGNNGVYGFKPTTKRLPLSGMSCTMKGNESVLPTLGPLARDRETLNLFMKVILDTEPWRTDPDVYPKKWTPVTFDKPLKIAIQYDNGVVKPHPPVIRALKEVADACRAAGMQVVDWENYKHDKGWDIISRLYWPDGGAESMSVIAQSGEPVLPLTEWIMNQPGVRSLNWPEFWALLCERDAFRAEHAQHWSATATNGEQEVDVILCPIVPGAAPPHDCARYWPYASHWNLLDHPAAIFPVTFVDQEKDKKEEDYVPRNADDKFNYDLYTPERYLGAPISLQIVGRRHFDEKVMAALAAVEKAMGRE